jgi:hypothetical protein
LLFYHQILYVSNEIGRVLARLKAQFLVKRYSFLAYSRNILAKPRIKMIFNGVISSARDYLGDFGPAVSQLAVCLNELEFLQITPLGLTYQRVQMIVPSSKIK